MNCQFLNMYSTYIGMYEFKMIVLTEPLTLENATHKENQGARSG